MIALPKSWTSDPWTSLDDAEHPDRWDDRLPILVLPEEPDKLDATSGALAQGSIAEAPQHRAFFAAARGSTNAFLDRDLLILARAEMKAQEWSGQNPEY